MEEKKDALKTDAKASTNCIQLAQRCHTNKGGITQYYYPTHSVSESEQCVRWGGNPGHQHSSSSLKKQVFQSGLQHLPGRHAYGAGIDPPPVQPSHLLHLVGPWKSDTLHHVAFGHRHPCQPHPHSLGIWACRLGIMPRLRKPSSLPSSERD